MLNARSSGERGDPQAQGPEASRSECDGAKEGLDSMADGYDSGARHSRQQHDQQQCGAHSSGVSTSTEDSCRTPNQRPVGGNQDLTMHQSESYEQHTAQWRGEGRPHHDSGPWSTSTVDPRRARDQPTRPSNAQWYGTGPYSGMGHAYAPPPPGYAAPAMYISEQRALGQACAASVSALMAQHNDENEKRWRHRQDMEKAIHMAADRIITGVTGPMDEHGSRVLKFVLADMDGLVYCWKQAGSPNDRLGPIVDFPGGKVKLGETFLEAAHRELSEELNPYGPDLWSEVEATVDAHPNGHSSVWVQTPGQCLQCVDTPCKHRDCLIVIWGIRTSRGASLKHPFAVIEPFTPMQPLKHIQAEWCRPLLVWESFRGPRAQYGAAAQRAYMPNHVSIRCALLTATGLKGVREFTRLCEAAEGLLSDGVTQVVCLLDHGLLPKQEHETFFAGKHYELTLIAQKHGFTILVGHADQITGRADMLMVKNGEVKMKASTHSTRITLEWRGLEYDVAEWTVCKNWTRGQWIMTHRLELMNMDLQRATSMDDFLWSETWTIEEVWLDPTRVNESERDKWNAIIGRWEAEGGGERRGEVATARRERESRLRSAAATTRQITLALLGHE